MMEQEKTKRAINIIEVAHKLDAYTLKMIRLWLCIYMQSKKGEPVQRNQLEQDFHSFLRQVASILEDIVDNPKKYHFLLMTKDNKQRHLREYNLDKEIKKTQIKYNNGKI